MAALFDDRRLRQDALEGQAPMARRMLVGSRRERSGPYMWASDDAEWRRWSIRAPANVELAELDQQTAAAIAQCRAVTLKPQSSGGWTRNAPKPRDSGRNRRAPAEFGGSTHMTEMLTPEYA